MAPIACILAIIVLFPGNLYAGPPQSKADGSSESAQRTPNAGYRLGANDVIRVQVFGEDALSTETRVSGDGKVTLPLLGVLEIKGLSVKETEELIGQRLSEGYIKNPRVSIYITRYRNVYVSGAVKSPGGYPYEDGLTVMKALTLGGGFTEKSSKATKGRIKIKRAIGGEDRSFIAQPEDLVFPDDVVIVPDWNFFVSGEVKTPGWYPYEDGLTVLKAVTLAGGFTNKAAEGRVKIKRLKGKEEETVRVKLEDPIFHDDVIVVPESFF